MDTLNQNDFEALHPAHDPSPRRGLVSITERDVSRTPTQVHARMGRAPDQDAIHVVRRLRLSGSGPRSSQIYHFSELHHIRLARVPLLLVAVPQA